MKKSVKIKIVVSASIYTKYTVIDFKTSHTYEFTTYIRSKVIVREAVRIKLSC